MQKICQVYVKKVDKCKTSYKCKKTTESKKSAKCQKTTKCKKPAKCKKKKLNVKLANSNLLNRPKTPNGQKPLNKWPKFARTKTNPN